MKFFFWDFCQNFFGKEGEEEVEDSPPRYMVVYIYIMQELWKGLFSPRKLTLLFFPLGKSLFL